MAEPSQSRRYASAGGSLLALSIVAGAVIGTTNQQPTIGALAGLGVGSLLFLLIWLLDRRRG